MKRFSTLRDTQRGSQSYMKKRSRKEMEMRRRIKRGDSREVLEAVLCFLIVLRSPEHP